ncbi:ComEC/Rec2 family competence protein [Bradyrhizobium neotropicale]|uniref:Competence protein ComEC n=1 Tax=Bradyrhizobium neotropicale TaxID=1497615 RepID=A0A176ZFF1_9BRAD|nr:MBL fold metallo-hydrolase [Bradyrhizobium neotropicale]OAF19197.1 competence protein ComEC [Bradyrhizobium neotropicale]
MANFFEIDFLDVEAKSSGDAICVRYELNGQTFIHVVDGGYQSTGEKVVGFVNKYYGNPKRIDHVIATHNDGDHAGGLQRVLEDFEVGAPWMLRPWVYAAELLPRFKRFTTVEGLEKALREAYSNLAALEEIALRKKISIYEPFQGSAVGAFRVMAPTRSRFLDLVVSSDKTPEEKGLLEIARDAVIRVAKEASALARAAWGDEYFPAGETSNENEMSVVQYACLNDCKILLTGDTGRAGLQEIIDYAPSAGLTLPGIDRFQVPHHGGRHNVTTELLDKILGERKTQQGGKTTFSAIISSAKADEDHPRKSVVRAMHHRGAHVISTEGSNKRTSKNAPERDDYSPAECLPYPDEQED